MTQNQWIVCRTKTILLAAKAGCAAPLVELGLAHTPCTTRVLTPGVYLLVSSALHLTHNTTQHSLPAAMANGGGSQIDVKARMLRVTIMESCRGEGEAISTLPETV